ncbi:MAG: peptide-methionine (S)-S-oxide reductase MsrA [Gammaproteobacteria bacterium]|nr:peptide-methionine (S)-S-oxide reductase MsrA [Gammaproteobacteria bacterium]
MKQRNCVPKLAALIVAATFSVACAPSTAEEETETAAPDKDVIATAIFAGGCFWCMEPPYDKLDGVVSTTSGYTGGNKPDPTYEEVSADETGHFESVQVEFEPDNVSYEELLEVFWHNIDPLDDGGQFCDRGSSYRSAIFYATDEQQRLAEQSKTAIEASGRFEQPIVTQILPAAEFYPAEDYHQNYYEVNPLKYKFYRFRCGRDDRLEELWGDEAE